MKKFDSIKRINSLTESCTRQRFNEIIDDVEVSKICKRIYLAMVEYRAAKTEETRKLIKNEQIAPLKKQLPGFCFLASFPSGHRRVADAVPSGLALVDVDGIDHPRKLWEEIELQARELGAVLAHITPSTMGLRIVFRVPPGMTVIQAKQWFEMKLELQNADPAVKDLSRISFAVPRSYFLYLDEDALFSEAETDERTDTKTEVKTGTGTDSGTVQLKSNTIKNENRTPEIHLPAVITAPISFPKPNDAIKQLAPKTEVAASQKKADSPANADSPATAVSSAKSGGYSMNFKGIAYSTIISRLLFALGVDGDPVEGERNTTLFKLARELRYICDFNVNHVMSVIPYWGLSYEEARLTVTSAISTVRSASMPPNLARIIKECEAEMTSASEVSNTDFGFTQNAVRQSMQIPRLPRMLQLLVKPYPEDYHAAVVIASLSILGTLATKVRSTYIDGSTHSLSFISCVVAPQASGKSFTRTLVNKLMRKMMAQDAVAREVERQYMEEKKVLKNANKLPEDPRVKIRILPPLCSNAMLFKRLDCAGGEHCFSFVEEIDTLTKGQKAGAWCQKDDLLRQAFDNSIGGQDYLSETSWSAMVEIYYNLLMCGTPSAIKRFFSDVENGLVSRVCFAQLPDMLGAPIPVLGTLSEEEENEIQHWVTYLMDEGNPMDESLTNGTIHYDVPRVRERINSWLEAQRCEYLETQDNPALDIFRRRAGVIGFRAGVLAMLLCDHMESDMVLDLAEWVASYVLVQQLSLFGHKMNEAMNTTCENEEYEHTGNTFMQPYSNSSVKLMFRNLPKEFDTETLIRMRRETGYSTRVNMVLSRWSRSGWIEKIANNQWRKIS